MNKYLEMYKRLEDDWQNYLENKGKLTYEDMLLIKELVDKETPKKLSEAKIQYSIEIPAYMVVKTCPKCNRKFDYKNMGVNYCSICGQHLDWSD